MSKKLDSKHILIFKLLEPLIFWALTVLDKNFAYNFSFYSFMSLMKYLHRWLMQPQLALNAWHLNIISSYSQI